MTSGPNTGKAATTLTDVNGQATFSYLGDGGTGTDVISVLVTGIFTCEAQVTWENVCPRGQGYWKNHPAEWPASALPMMLGTSKTYTKEQLLANLKTPVAGDASLILAYQLIAAKLNIAAGAAAPAPVPATIAAADAAIGTKAIPMKTKPNTAAGQTMTSLAATLDAYNNGSLNAGCNALPKGTQNSNGITTVPGAFVLENYPNPFNPTTTIEYALPVDARVTLEVYDVLGRRVAELVNGYVPAGYYAAEFDASTLASGVYLYRIKADGIDGKTFNHARKLVLVK